MANCLILKWTHTIICLSCYSGTCMHSAFCKSIPWSMFGSSIPTMPVARHKSFGPNLCIRWWSLPGTAWVFASSLASSPLRYTDMELQHLYVDAANGPTVLWKDMKGNNNQNKYATGPSFVQSIASGSRQEICNQPRTNKASSDHTSTTCLAPNSRTAFLDNWRHT